MSSQTCTAGPLAFPRVIKAFLATVVLIFPVVCNGWSMPEFTKDLKVPDGIPNIFTTESEDGTKSEASGFTKILGCIGGGAAGYLAAKKLAGKDAKMSRGKLSAQKLKEREKAYLVGFGLAGCGLGVAASASMVEKLSDKARAKREASLTQALDDAAKIQSSGKPVTENVASWQHQSKNGGNARGNVNVSQYEMMPDGTKCFLTDETIYIDGDSGQALSRMCKKPGSSKWEIQTA